MKYVCKGCSWICRLRVNTKEDKFPNNCPYNMKEVQWQRDLE